MAGRRARRRHGEPPAPAPGHGEQPAPGHGGHGAAARRTASIGMGAFAFLPAHVDVLAGDTVTWSNESVRRHTVSAPDGSWDLGTLLSGDERSRTFSATGTADYFCRLHAGMAGHVAVHRLLLDRPRGSAAPGRPFPLTGRAALRTARR
jgi:plastocyanin